METRTVTTETCKTIQLELLAGHAHEDHLAVCADCRAFAAAFTQTLAVELPEHAPSTALDQRILAHAAQRQSSRWRRRPPLLLMVLAAAAAMILAFAMRPQPGQPAIGDPGVNLVRNEAPKTTSDASDPELTMLLAAVADADFSGNHIDEELLALELQLAAMSVESF